MKYAIILLSFFFSVFLVAQPLPRAKDVLTIAKLHPDKRNNYVNLVATELQERLLEHYHFREYSIYKILVDSNLTNKRKSRSKKKNYLADVHITVKGYNILNPIDSFVLVKTIRGRGLEDKDIYKNAIKKYWRDADIFTELQSNILAMTDQPCDKFEIADALIDTPKKVILTENALKSMLPNSHCLEAIKELKIQLREKRDEIACKNDIQAIKKQIASENYNAKLITGKLIRISPFALCKAKAINVAKTIKSNLKAEDELEAILDSFIEALEEQDIHVWSRLQMKL